MELTQAIDWAQFWQPIVPALVGLIVAFLTFLGIVLGSAGLAIRSMVKASAGKEASYLKMVEANNTELKTLREEQRQADKHEQSLLAQINDIRLENTRKHQEIRVDYENRVAKAEQKIVDLQAKIQEKDKQIADAEKARRAAETAQALAEMQRDQDRKDFVAQIEKLQTKIIDLELQIRKLKESTQELDKISETELP